MQRRYARDDRTGTLQRFATSFLSRGARSWTARMGFASSWLAMGATTSAPPSADTRVAIESALVTAERVAAAIETNSDIASRSFSTELVLTDFESNPSLMRGWCLNELPPPVPGSVQCRIDLSASRFRPTALQQEHWKREPGGVDSIPGYAGSEVVSEWDGRTWCLFSPGEREATLSSVREIGTADEVLPFFNLTADPGILGSRGLPSAIRTGGVPKIEVADGRMKLEFSSLDAKSFWSITVDAAFIHRVQALRLWRLNDRAKIDYVTTIDLEDWREHDQCELPWKARYRTWRVSVSPTLPEGLSRWTAYERKQWQSLTEPPTPLSLPDQTAVVDQRIDASYRIGESQLEVFGVQQSTTVPVTDWRSLPEQLPTLLVQRTVSDASETHPSWTVLRRIGSWIGGFVAVACGALLIARRVKYPALTTAGSERRRKWLVRVGASSLLLLVALVLVLPFATPAPEAQPAQLAAAANAASPLRGVSAHQFSQVTVGPSESRVLEHQFELTNSSPEVIEIEGVKTSCGCTRCEPSTRRLGPGDTVRIRAQLTLRGPSSKSERAWLELSGGGIHELRIAGSATALTARHLWPLCLSQALPSRVYCVEATEVDHSVELSLRHFSRNKPELAARLVPRETATLFTYTSKGSEHFVRWIAYEPVTALSTARDRESLAASLDGVPWISN